MTFQVQLLDAFQATIHNKTVQFRTDKIRGLLAYLALQEGPQPKEKLATLLWGNKSDKNARTNLRVSLSRLKKTIDKHAAVPLSDKLIISSSKAIQFVLDDPAVPVWVDVLAIQKLFVLCEVHQHQALHHCPLCLTRLAEAVDLYQGEFLPGLNVGDSEPFDEWLLLMREQLHQRIVFALDTLVTGLTAQQQLEDVLGYGQRLLTLEPWHEKTHRHLMLMLAIDGQRGAALSQYERCRQILWEELGVEPAAETTALYNKIITQQPLTVQSQLVTGRRTRQAAVPPLTQHNLPRQLTPFFGRQTEQKRLMQLLLSPDNRLITVTGEGGIGKSRLVIEVAKQLLPSFEDGVWFVPLAGLEGNAEQETAEEQIAIAIAQVLKLSLGGHASYKTQVVKQLQGRHLLLIIDNFEHLLAGADLVLELLQETAAVSVLCTSRTPLGYMAEYLVPIQQLPLPSPDTAAPLTNFSSVELFIDRAQRVTGSFALSTDNTADVVTLCRHVAGIPLGLELAAAMLRQQSLPDTVTLLQQSLDAIRTTLRDIPARHASMRAVFESSWQLLTAAEQLIVAQLAVFRGGFDFSAATAIVGVEPSVLETLQEKSFFTRTAEGRYTMHELLRQFAAEKRQAMAAAQQIDAAHGRYYLRFLAEREQAIAGAKPQDEVALIAADEPNIEQAWLWAVAQRQAEPLLAGAQTLADYLQMRGRYRDGVRLFHQAAEALAHNRTDPPPDSVARAMAHLHVHEAAVLVRLGQYDEAYQLALLTIEEGSTMSDAWVQGYAHLQLTECLWQRGSYDAALQQAGEILAFANRAENHRLQGAGHYHLNIVYYYLEQYDKAKGHVQQAIEAWHQAENKRLETYALNSLGILLMAQQELVSASQTFRQALDLADETGDRQAKMSVLNNLSMILTEQENFEAAEHYLQQAQQLAKSAGNKASEADNLHNLGRNALQQQQFEKAGKLFRQSLKLSQLLQDAFRVAYTLQELGHLSVAQKQYTQAEEHYKKALQISQAASISKLLHQVEDSIAELVKLRAKAS